MNPTFVEPSPPPRAAHPPSSDRWLGSSVFTERVLKVCINLNRRPDRWARVKAHFKKHGLEVTRQSGINASWVNDPRGFREAQRYACSLAKRLAIRRAINADADAILILEDDVVFDARLREILSSLTLPADWGIFFLGCRHLELPTQIDGRLVRVNKAIDHHAMLVRSTHFREVSRALAGGAKKSEQRYSFSDLKLAQEQGRIPTYALLPNLAWQEPQFSDGSRAVIGHYDKTGHQIEHREAILALEEKMSCTNTSELTDDELPIHSEVPACDIKESAHDIPNDAAPVEIPEASFNFLAHLRQCHALESSFDGMLYLNLSKRGDRRNEAELQFMFQELSVTRFPAADTSKSKNTRGHTRRGPYGCALSHRMMLRHAKHMKWQSVLIFEDDVVLHPNFRRMAECIALPDDWGIFFYGCVHMSRPEIVSPGLVKVTRAHTTHAYAVRHAYYDRVISAMGRGLPHCGVRACDVILGHLASEIPTYAVYPNFAWQSESLSSIEGFRRKQFLKDGSQANRRYCLSEVDRLCRDSAVLPSDILCERITA